jgi:hypothetical protein
LRVQRYPAAATFGIDIIEGYAEFFVVRADLIEDRFVDKGSRR